MYDKCYFCLDQLPKLKKESTASFFVNFGGAGVQKSRPTLLYILHWTLNILHSRQRIKKEGTRPRFCQIVGIWRRIHFLSLFVSRDASKFDAHIYND